MTSLLACNCTDEVCTCSDPFQTGELDNFLAAKTNKGSPMLYDEVSQKINAAMSHPKAKLSGAQKFNRLSDYLLSCSDPDREKLLTDIVQAAPNLPIATLKRLSFELSAAAKAKETQQSGKVQRLQRLAAAMESDDPAIDSQIRYVGGELRRLGYGDNAINAHAKNGIDALALHKRAKDAAWKPERVINLKAQATAIGLIE
jgi:hypothetical protein